MALTKEQKVGIGAALAAVGTFFAWKYLKAIPPMICKPGNEKCIGIDWCRCKDDGTGWIVVTPNATECLPPVGTAILEGEVTDANTGTLIAGIVVDCGGYTNVTETDGLYRIGNIPPGTYLLTFTDPSGRYQSCEYDEATDFCIPI